ncbi:NAD(P)/FAD-dependent oxidoreductase [Streptomyces zhihengii]|uniref:NAD(P)/FAD-dependent oxidoreductase n=1 Tax=Streptomyces zhihengii TaxID=1818004 RepID=UPI0033A3A544
MSNNDPFVIIGGGLAAGRAAEALREHGHRGPVTIVTDEPERPYTRPPLSKEYLLGKKSRESIYVHPEAWYADQDVDLMLSRRVTALDPLAKRVALDDGQQIPYAKLLLATGASPRRLTAHGAECDNVLYLRRVTDSERLKEAFVPEARIVVIGGGWIGLETAAAARMAGADVTVLERSDMPLQKVLGREAAEVFVSLHSDQGVRVQTRAEVDHLTGGDGRADGVRLTDGSHLPADTVVVGVGVTPNDRLAREAGLEVDNGVVTDQALRTSAADIYAAGDVANAYHPRLERRLRVEHWANALHQPRTAAANMLGRNEAYERLPYFYTDQYDLGMEYIGYVPPGGADRVVFRGSADERKFIAFYLSGNRILAGMSVNVWDVIEPIRTLIESESLIDDTRLANPDVPLEALFG